LANITYIFDFYKSFLAFSDDENERGKESSDDDEIISDEVCSCFLFFLFSEMYFLFFDFFFHAFGICLEI